MKRRSFLASLGVISLTPFLSAQTPIQIHPKFYQVKQTSFGMPYTDVNGVVQYKGVTVQTYEYRESFKTFVDAYSIIGGGKYNLFIYDYHTEFDAEKTFRGFTYVRAFLLEKDIKWILNDIVEPRYNYTLNKNIEK